MKVVNSLLENSFAVIEMLAHEARSMRLTEISDRLGLQRSGTHRMLATLTALGWVEQDHKTELYRLSLKLSAIGHRFLQASKIPDVCQPILDRLAQETRELVRLAVLANNNLTTIPEIYRRASAVGPAEAGPARRTSPGSAAAGRCRSPRVPRVV